LFPTSSLAGRGRRIRCGFARRSRHLIERGDGLRLVAIENGEVSSFQPANVLFVFVDDDDVNLHELDVGTEDRRLGCLCRQSSRERDDGVENFCCVASTLHSLLLLSSLS
jgi:hypothetical protein